MSWMFGIVGNHSDSDLQKFRSIHPTPIYLVQSRAIYIAAGGLQETCFCSSTTDHVAGQTEGWIVCGTGIKYDDGQLSLMTSNDWKRTLSKKTPDLKNLNGHFVLIKWNKDQVTCFNDQLGLRDLYFTKMNSYTGFSTRLDWISKLNKNCKINFEEFGASWLMYNQLSDKSMLTNTDRLASGGTAVCKPESITIQNKLWEPEMALDLHSCNLLPVFEEALSFPMYEENNVSLGLSGGLDSRVLLSFLLSGKYTHWSLHSFGNPDHPDAVIARQISSDVKADYTHLKDTVPAIDTCVPLLREYIGQTCINIPASYFFRQRDYSSLYEQQKIIISGAFGEILRRQLFKRLSMLGKKALLNGDAKNISTHLSLHRASIFNVEISQVMQEGVYNQIRMLWEKMPSIQKFGIENWLDLLAVRTTLPNSLGREQMRMDGKIISYMPYAQPSLLKCVFDISVNERRNGKIFRKIIDRNCSKLSKYPLVKGQVSYPFGFSPVPTWLWIKAKKKLGYYFEDTLSIRFLENLSEYVQDTVHSTSVKKFEYYDYPKILNMVKKFYAGDKQYAGELDWWLTFEIWRQTIYDT